MAKASTTISATKRDGIGKGSARTTRREGRVPGVLYGHGEESIPLSVDARELERLVQSVSVENTIVDLALKGTRQPYKVLIREVQRHATRDQFLHVDFFHVAMDEKISVEVPIVVTGEPVGVRTKGGILDYQLRELSVVCLPGDIPEKIEVDVAHLDIGAQLDQRIVSQEQLAKKRIRGQHLAGLASRQLLSRLGFPPPLIGEPFL